ncbi:helix-turn-helix domain-containing protein [Dyadobacter sp. CY323]|uniref:helix-turn-helix domain-containing protein n=1 Tax=Dyadobacter sp. CY323 TaxID=2907302 RepID=UPI001F3592CC|nr:helix-turn-helix domain-containing protein [Dyadobacter sp. CY323]MCE6988053.1 helix-turn-helix domain-containing protein [Dyadobacter sp. CY323]
MKTISDQIRTLRKAKALSQEALAENAGINLRTLQRIESGNAVPRGETLRLLAQALDISVEELSASMDESPVATNGAVELREDHGFLKLMNLSALTFWFIPLGNILVPFALWIYKRNTVAGANDLGKRILNFQITWSVIVYGLAFVMTFSSLAGRFFVNPFVLVGSITFLQLAVSVYIFINNKKIAEGDGDLYTTSLKIIH